MTTTETIESPEKTDANVAIAAASSAPELDGSIDALVANLRAAKEKLAALLVASPNAARDNSGEAPKADRTAA